MWMFMQYINLEPLIEYLTKEIKTDDLSNLLDDLIFDYTIMFFRLYELDRVSLRGNPEEYVYYLIRLRDSLKLCKTI